MTKPRKEYNETTNRSVYNKARKIILERDGNIHCSFCRYHSGENNDDKYYEINHSHEKHHSRYPNWKLSTKNKKQWMKKRLKIKHVIRQHFYQNGILEYDVILVRKPKRFI